jgi:Na+(H+)/acetate symporter ActP
MPLFLSEILPHGLLGLVVAGMLAAFMSTHDSYLLCWSTIITNDIVEPLNGEKLSSLFKIKITRIIIIILGIYIYYWGMFYEGSDAIWDYLGITGAIYFTGAISVIVFGLYWEKASSTGAFLSLLGGLSSLIGLEPIREFLQIDVTNPAIIGLFSLSFSILLMVLGSLIWPDKENKFKINESKMIKSENLISNYLIFEILVIFLLFLSYLSFGPQSLWFKSIISWKLIWQIVLIFVFIVFFGMFLIFTVSGYKDLKEMLGYNYDK